MAPTHDAETQGRLTDVTWADDLFLLAKSKVDAEEVTTAVVNALLFQKEQLAVGVVSQ